MRPGIVTLAALAALLPFAACRTAPPDSAFELHGIFAVVELEFES